MKKILCVLSCIFIMFVCYSFCFAETDVRYQGKVCKMEIFSTGDVSSRNKFTIVKNEVEKFCTDKYIYDIKVFVEKGEYVFIVFYN
ncbi:hypothetical protein [Candidatus Ruminimicrobium bovinum]|uniref:hypothetical protein n=1 Tax=Candidatus Ruminimicrobium bovinum TaxID=3242779 RepID=UPI0039B99216